MCKDKILEKFDEFNLCKERIANLSYIDKIKILEGEFLVNLFGKISEESGIEVLSKINQNLINLDNLSLACETIEELIFDNSTNKKRISILVFLDAIS